MDYVQPAVFGVGVNPADKDHHREDCELMIETIKKQCSRYGKLVEKLEAQDEAVDQLMLQIVALCQRYDNRVDMMINGSGDQFQVELTRRLFNEAEARAIDFRMNQDVRKKILINMEE